MSDGIKLQFINQSNDNSWVVIFQKNVARNFNEIAVAWRVIHNTGLGDSHSLLLPDHFTLDAHDSFGNFVAPVVAHSGDLFSVVSTSAAWRLQLAGTANSATQVQVRNDLQQGSIDVQIYKDGRLLAVKTNVTPQQIATFEFDPSIWIGVVEGIIEGEIMSSAILQTIQTQLALTGITAADIIMTGGGPGSTATPVKFTLANVVRA